MILPLRLATRLPAPSLAPACRFTAAAPLAKAKAAPLPPRPKPPPEDDILESFVKGSGPGGQKINKTNSAVQLKHLPTGIVVKSQATRSRSQNRLIARNVLAARLDELANGTESRAAAVADRKRKKRASALKKSRRKHRAHEKDEQDEQNEQDEGGTNAEEGIGDRTKGKGDGACLGSKPGDEPQ